MPADRPSPLAWRLWPGHLLLVLSLLAAAGLAWWQYAAWAAEREHAALDLTNAAAKPLEEVMGPDDTFPAQDLGRRVTFTGEWLPQSTLFVTDRPHDGKRGYWVITPVRINDSAMPVVRGWSAEPEAPKVTGTATIEGWLHAGEGSKGVDPDPHDDQINAVRLASMTEHVEQDLYSAYVLSQTPTATLSAVPNDAVPPISSNTALRNLLYALQWLIFGAFATYIWWKWLQDQGATTEQIDSEP